MIKRQKWQSTGDLVKTFKWRAGIQPDKISILAAVWEKVLGPYSKHWPLVAVKRGVLYVKPRSSAAAQELHMRSSSILRELNKYFSRNWITAIRSSFR